MVFTNQYTQESLVRPSEEVKQHSHWGGLNGELSYATFWHHTNWNVYWTSDDSV